MILGMDLLLPSYQQNEKHTFFWTTRWSVAGVVATYIGIWDYRAHVDLVLAQAHVTPAFWRKYQKHINCWNINETYRQGFIRKEPIRDDAEHQRILGQLGYTNQTQAMEVIHEFESGVGNPYNFPLMAESLEGLPPTHILACEYDTLRDDALLYAHRLTEDGVTVDLDHQMEGWHGIIPFVSGMFTVPAANRALDNLVDFIRGLG